MTLRRWSVVALALAALLLLVGRVVAGVYVDYRWYDAMGALSLWKKKTVLSLVLRLASGAAAAAFVFANLYAVRRSVVSLVLPRRVANIEIGEEVPGRYLVGAAAILSIILGALLTLPRDTWSALSLVRSGILFGESDPYFEADLGFFVYWLPFESALYLWALIAVLLVTAVVIFLYALTPSLRWERGALYVSSYVRRHLVALGSMLLLVLAWSYRLDAYRVLLDGSGPDGAFTFTDHRAVIPVSLWLWILTSGAAFVVLFFGWTGQVRVAFVAVSAVLVLALGLRQLAPVLVRHFAVGDPEERERPYQRVRADYTRRAYGIDRVARADSSLIFPALRDAATAAPVWEPAILLRSITRLGRSESVAEAVGWTASPLGLLASVPQRPARTGATSELVPWSLTQVIASAADARGDPVRASSPTGGRDDGELAAAIVYDSVISYAVVPDTMGRIAAPELSTWTSRLAHAWSLQNFRLLFGDLPRPEPRIVTRRDVRERLRAFAPFFAQGASILPVVSADTLYWSVDLYAATAFYPLSERTPVDRREYSYLQHAAIGVVNSHTGRITIVPDSVRDPIAQTWVRTFPSLFSAWASLPAGLEGTIPPPVDGARVQAHVLARYGMRGEAPRNGHVAGETADSLARSDSPVLLSTPTREALMWTQPVLDVSDRVVGLLIARGGRGGGMYWLPATEPGARWPSILDQLRRGIDSTALLSRDARLVHGSVQAIPLTGGVAFVEPAYAWTADGPPTLLRVGLSSGGAASTGRTLAEAIGAPVALARDTIPALQDLRSRAAALYDQMRAALQRGDWAAFGRAYDALGALLGRPPH